MACLSNKGSLTMIVQRPMPIIALSSSSHLGMIQEPQKKIKYVQKKQNAAVHDQSASFRNLIGECLDLRWRQSEICIVLFGKEIQRSFDLMNDSKHFVESKIRNYCEGSN